MKKFWKWLFPNRLGRTKNLPAKDGTQTKSDTSVEPTGSTEREDYLEPCAASEQDPTSKSEVVVMQAFHNSLEIKERYLARVLAHQAADEIIKDVYWQDGCRGCAIGCTIHGESHFVYERELGIPAVLAMVEDSIFQGLPLCEAKKWPAAFLSAIRPGADLSKIWTQFVVWLLDDPTDGVIRFADSTQSHQAIKYVTKLYQEGCTDQNTWAVAAKNAGSVGLEFGWRFQATWPTPEAKRIHMAAVKATLSASSAAAWAAGSAKEARSSVADTVCLAASIADADDDNHSTNTVVYMRQSEKLLELLRAA